jgi:predicted transcriptional regulator
METTPIFAFRLAAELQEALKREAENEDRTPSGLARKIITDWLKRRQEKAK